MARDKDRHKDKDPNAVALGQRGGKARNAVLSPERRKEIARKAARARWSKSGAKE
jgi:general stress protein YciG